MTKYVNLGKSGLKVSRLSLGTMTYGSRKWREWVLEEEESRPFIKLALELGINFFDTADKHCVRKQTNLLIVSIMMI
jgi:1-deoxyxylulose-5-phosphate synthase